jgi:osmotically inducible protein OsmC
MQFKRTAQAHWLGSAKNGQGTFTSDSKTLNNSAFSFPSRFESGDGTNPEELIAAAHAGCYSMALSFILAKDGIKSEEIKTAATVTIESVGEGFEITTVHLVVTGKVPGIDESTFKKYTEMAKTGCAVSRLIKAAISLESKFIVS